MAIASALRIAQPEAAVAVAPVWATGFVDWVDFAENVGTTDLLALNDNSVAMMVESSTGWTLSAANQQCRGDLGYQVTPTRTNGIRNPIANNAVIGSPGTMPTYWATGTSAGLTREVVAVGTENGMPYIDVRFSGTATSSGPVVFYFESSGIIPTVQNETRTLSIFAKSIAAPLPPLAMGFRFIGYDAGLISNETRDLPSALTSIGPSLLRYSGNYTMTTSTTVSTRPAYRASITNGLSYDWTIRLAVPQDEKGTVATPPILNNGSSAPAVPGNIVTKSLGTRAQAGFGGVVQVWIRSINALNLPILLGINPSTAVGQALTDASADLGTLTVGLKTIAFAYSEGYAKVRLVGGTDVPATAPRFQPDVDRLSLGGNGVDASNNVHALFRKLALEYGAFNDTRFAGLYSRAGLMPTDILGPEVHNPSDPKIGANLTKCAWGAQMVAPDGSLSAVELICDGQNDPILAYNKSGPAGFSVNKKFRFEVYMRTLDAKGIVSPKAGLYGYSGSPVVDITNAAISPSSVFQRFSIDCPLTSLSAAGSFITGRLDPYDGANNTPPVGASVVIWRPSLREIFTP